MGGLTRFQHLLLRGSCCLMALQGISEAALSLTTDHRPISFGVMELEEQKTLAQSGTYHNQITCTSTNGQPWYLKISVLTPFASVSSPGEMIPLEQLTWRVVWTNGKGIVAAPHEFTPFSSAPQLVYMSHPDEASGQPVSLQLTYALQVPEVQVSGIYQTTIRLTFTELL